MIQNSTIPFEVGVQSVFSGKKNKFDSIFNYNFLKQWILCSQHVTTDLLSCINRI